MEKTKTSSLSVQDYGENTDRVKDLKEKLELLRVKLKNSDKDNKDLRGK